MTDNPHLTPVRLNKFLAQHLAIGRRQVDYFIERGRVLVNGIEPELGARVTPGVDKITVDDEPVATTSAQGEFIYLLLNKPVGYICSRAQQGDTPTIYSLLPPEYQHLKPIGRLDKDSSGLLVLTNDGDFAYKLTHPKFVKIKEYEVTLDKPLEPLHQQMINDFGVTLGDGKSKLTLEKINDDPTKWHVTMHEGRNRQIRRTFGSLGYDVAKLNRVQFGRYSLHEVGDTLYKLSEAKQ